MILVIVVKNGFFIICMFYDVYGFCGCVISIGYSIYVVVCVLYKNDLIMSRVDVIISNIVEWFGFKFGVIDNDFCFFLCVMYDYYILKIIKCGFLYFDFIFEILR